MMIVAGYQVQLLNAGWFRLDGGGLFGVVPRTMWQPRVEQDSAAGAGDSGGPVGAASPDESNRVRISTTCLLLSGHGRRVLIESGLGDKLSAKEREVYGVEGPGVVGALAQLGVEPGAIDAVVLTHLHFDHAGGATSLDAAGRARPTFPRARVFVQRRELQDAQTNNSHMKTTYRPENFQPLVDAGCVEPLDGPADILPNIRVEPAPGHTAGSQAVLVGGGGTSAGGAAPTLCFIGDIVATHYHLRPLWTMGYDSEPMVTNVTRARLVERAVAQRWAVVYPHDDRPGVWRIKLDEKGRWMAEEIGNQ